jgi:hypothetical protein
MVGCTAALFLSGCNNEGTGKVNENKNNTGRIPARPSPPKNSAPTGLQSLGLDTKRDALLYVPTGYQLDKPRPLVVMLHGADTLSRPPSSRRRLTGFLNLKDLGFSLEPVTQSEGKHLTNA